MSFRVHGVCYLRFDADVATEQDAIAKFKAEHPEAEIQGVEPQDGEYIQFIGTCEHCRAAVFQNDTYEITEKGVRHSECTAHESYAI